MQEADPEVFKNNFANLMKRYDWTETEKGNTRDWSLSRIILYSQGECPLVSTMQIYH